MKFKNRTPLKKFEEKKDSKIQMVVWSIVGAFALIFNRIIKKNKGGK